VRLFATKRVDCDDMAESRAKMMAEILRRQYAGESVIKSAPVQETLTVVKAEDNFIASKEPTAATRAPIRLLSAPKRKFELRGLLYRKFLHHIEEITSSGRAGQLMGMQRGENVTYPTFVIYPTQGMTNLLPHETVKIKSMIYPLAKPYSYANIKTDKDGSLLYNVMEPELTEYEKKIFEKLKEGLMQVIDVRIEDVAGHNEILDYLEKNVRELLKEYGFVLSTKEYLKIMYFISRDFIGLNEIQPLMLDPFIEDIGCDGNGVPVYVVHQRYGSLRTNVIFKDMQYLKDFVTKLAERCDRYISYAEPLLDGTLPDGARIQASLAEDVTTRGPTFSIRKFRQSPFTPADMITLNTASAEMLAYLWFAVENGVNILIAGGVATGKTSFLNTLSMFIRTEAKIVSIEDTRELSLPHENWIPGAARTGFAGSTVGEVTMFDLLKESFRQNPDYLIVGEIRGKEAYVMFQAMSSGHPSISTMHAGSVDDVIKRLSTEPINISPGLLEVLDLVIVMTHAREKGKSARRVKEIVELESVDSVTGRPRISKSFVWIPFKDEYEYRGNSWVLHKISFEKGIPLNKIMGDIARRKVLLAWMAEKNVNTMSEAAKYMDMYSNAPETISALIGKKYEQAEDGDTGV